MIGFLFLGYSYLFICGIISLFIFHIGLRLFVREIKFSQTFGILLGMLFALGVLIMLSVPFWIL